LLERDGAIATLCFNRPQALNAIDVPMAQAFLQAMQQLTADATLRCLVLRGAGRGFMAGGDLATLAANPAQGAADLLGPLNQAVELLAQINVPVIAQVHGVAAGAGLSLMLQADFIYAAEDTRFNLAYINIGTSCDVGASWALPRRVGLTRALEIAMLGETLDCAKAERLGLINRTLPPAELEAAVQALAQGLATGPTQALGQMRRLMRAGLHNDLYTQLAAETQAFMACAHGHDLRHGIAAFQAKKKPWFQGY
jgi:2-(1,2-epoxy-1,2-dihydrophenyl)acetyl-CoA isomerase